MGSWNETDLFTGLPICVGDEVKVFILQQNFYSSRKLSFENSCYADDLIVHKIGLYFYREEED